MPPSIRDAIGWMYGYIEEGTTFLDFGCSTGYFGKYIKDTKSCKVYGVEISDDRFQAQKVLDGVYCFDLDGEWPKEVFERKYDYLFFGDVIEHLKDPRSTLEKAHRLLKKDGKIFISTPNIAHISTRLELLAGNFEYEPMGILDTTHLKYFTKSSLYDLVQNAGYTVAHFDFTPNDFPDASIKRLLAKAGVKATPKFWKLANSTEARAFQFKLILVLNPKDGVKKLSKGDVKAGTQKPEEVRNAMMDDLRQQVRQLRHHAEEQAKIIDHYVATNRELEKRTRSLQDRLSKKISAIIARSAKK